MRKPGSRRSRRRPSAERIGSAIAVLTVLAPSCALSDGVRARPAMPPILHEIASQAASDSIDASLTGVPGDPIRGRAIVADRARGLCLLCHAGPFPEQRFQGTIGPDLSGAGSRWSEGQLRQRIVDGRKTDPATVMPSYFRTQGLTRVAPAFAGKPILNANEIEDVVAYLVTLR
jgi:sulfur-oxidizing protein SoxX